MKTLLIACLCMVATVHCGGFDALCTDDILKVASKVEAVLKCMDEKLGTNLATDMDQCLGGGTLVDGLNASCKDGKLPQDKVDCIGKNANGFKGKTQDDIKNAAMACAPAAAGGGGGGGGA